MWLICFLISDTNFKQQGNNSTEIKKATIQNYTDKKE